MRPAIHFGLPALLCGVAVAQSQPDLAEILKKVSETYNAASQYEFVIETTQTDPPKGKPEVVHSLIAVRAPDRYRTEGVLADDDGKTSKRINIVLDGTTIWFYDPQLNQYASYPASSIGKDLPDEIEASGVDFSTMLRYRTAADFSATAGFLREETIEIAGAKIVCYVVLVREEKYEYTWWVDEKSNHILREDSDGSSAIFTTVKMGEPLPDSLFKFVVPPGARKNGGDRR